MDYEMEELVPIVAELAEKFTSKGSTSIPYERAQQLMEAVLYCIHEGEQTASFSVPEGVPMSPQLCYEAGVACVQKKVREALELYNRLMTQFSDYGNRCLYDTVVKGLPEFFKWYDWKYEPQNTILTLDYPILTDLSQKTGIDRVYDYLQCMELEQRFLGRFPASYVTQVLFRYNPKHQMMIENLSEIVLTDMMMHSLAGKNVSERIQTLDKSALRTKLYSAFKTLISEYYEDDEQLTEYLGKGIDNIAPRLKLWSWGR